jgi:hypothetical protein
LRRNKRRRRTPLGPRSRKRKDKSWFEGDFGLMSYEDLVEKYGFDDAHVNDRNQAIAREFRDGTWFKAKT